jgi:hypothetical protein
MDLKICIFLTCGAAKFCVSTNNEDQKDQKNNKEEILIKWFKGTRSLTHRSHLQTSAREGDTTTSNFSARNK